MGHIPGNCFLGQSESKKEANLLPIICIMRNRRRNTSLLAGGGRENAEMERKERLWTGRCTQMLVCFLGQDGSIPRGEILHHRLREPVAFGGERDLIIKIGEIGRQMGVSAGNGEGRQGNMVRPLWEKREWPLSGFPAGNYGGRTFYLELMARQGQGIQGRIRGKGLEEPMTYFRSGRELASILRDALRKIQIREVWVC